MASFEDAYKSYTDSDRGQTIANMQNAQTQANLASLQAAHDLAVSDAQAARGNIDTAYRANANNLGAQYEKNRRNLNTQAAANGINTGAGSQQQLALNNAYQRDYGSLMGQYGKDVAESERQMANLNAQYQAAVQQAQAEGDYNRMQALLNDFNTQRNEQLANAQTLAQYGDFSGYNGLMNEAQVAAMANEYNRRRGIEDEDRAYSRERDAIADRRYEDETAYNREWNTDERGYSRDLAQAQTLASFGDFSGYERMGYSPETVSAMREIWIASNPDLAYNTGAIDAERYRAMTGQYPAGYKAPGSGGWTGGSNKKPTAETKPETSPLVSTLSSLAGTGLSWLGDRIGNAIVNNYPTGTTSTGSNNSGTSKRPTGGSRVSAMTR